MFGTGFYENPILRTIMVIGLILAVVSFVRRLIKLIKGDKDSATGLTLLADLYVIGVLCKFLVLGPAFLRWYVGDIGFPVVMSVLLSDVSASIHRKFISPRDKWEYSRWLLKHRTVFVIIMGGVSWGYEFFIGYVYSQSNRAIHLIGDFDPVDLAMYTLGVLIALWFIRRHSKEVTAAQCEKELLLTEKPAAEEGPGPQ